MSLLLNFKCVIFIETTQLRTSMYHQWPIHIPSLDISCRDNKCDQQRSKSKATSHVLIAYVAAVSGLNTKWSEKGGFALGINIEVQGRLLLTEAQGFLCRYMLIVLKKAVSVMLNAWKTNIYF